MSSIKTKGVHFGSYRCDDDTASEADSTDLIEEAEAVLSVTPAPSSKKRRQTDLSAYLRQDEEPRQQHSRSADRRTPASLHTTKETALDGDSREMSDLLDYLNDLGIDSSPDSLGLAAPDEAHHHTPTKQQKPSRVSSGSIMTTEGSKTPWTLNRTTRNATTIQTPAQDRIFRDRSNQTWPAGRTKLFRQETTTTPLQGNGTATVEHDALSPIAFNETVYADLPAVQEETEGGSKENEIGNYKDDCTFELDRSLEQLLEETTDKMCSRQTTGHFSEQGWERLEKVQQMAEILLREAEHERESARRWAKQVRAAVQHWVEQQRAIVEETPIMHPSEPEQLNVTREVMVRLQLEMEEATLHHDAVKRHLNEVIRRQAETIQHLEAKLHDKAVANEHKFKSPKRTRSPFNSMRASRISLSPSSGRRVRLEKHKKRDMDPSSQILDDEMDPITPTKHEALPTTVPSPMSMTVATPRTERARTTLVNGGKLIVYRNGTEKETRPDGTCVIRFPNGDVKCTLGNESTVGIVAYYHAKEKTTRIRHGNGVEIYEYPNGQVERNFPDGRKDVRFPDGTTRKMLADGSKQTVFADGLIVREDARGKREITTGKGVAKN